MNVSPKLGCADRRPWLASYPSGVGATVDIGEYGSVTDLLAATAARHADSIAFRAGEVSLSFRQTFELARQWAAFLDRQLLGSQGERVAVVLPNDTAFPVCLLGALQSGAVQVSVNPAYTSREIRQQLLDSGARLVVASANVIDVVSEAAQDTAVELIVQHGGSVAQRGLQVPLMIWDEALAIGATHASRWVPPRLGLQDLALLQYTGGTTGVSKGARLSHGNLVANILQFRAMLGGAVFDAGEVIVTALPLYHIFGMTVNLLTFMSFGARNVLVNNARDAAQIAAAFLENDITVVTGVNTLFAALLGLPQLGPEHFRRIKLAIGGGSAIQRAISDAWHAKTGRHILEGYGLTETSPLVTINSHANRSFSGSVGLPVPSTDVRIAAEDGTPLAPGLEGEVCVKGPQVTQGYWGHPAATAAAFTQDGYFRTGDMGVLDALGQLRICDRKKDMILVSGFNVYPNEVEGVIAELDGILECAVTGVTDARTGEAVKAFIVPRGEGNAPAESAIREHCRKQLAAYKVPKWVEFVAELPKSSVGKILRRELRALEARSPGQEVAAP